MNFQKIFFAAIFFPLLTFGQDFKEIPRDTSYTAYTAYEKLLKDYPFIKIAVHVNEKSAPIIFINSSMDRFHAGRDEMIEKLNSFNIYYEVHTIEDSPHTFWLFHPWFERTAGPTIKFLDKIFKE